MQQHNWLTGNYAIDGSMSLPYAIECVRSLVNTSAPSDTC